MGHDSLPVDNPLPSYWTSVRDDFHNHRTTPELPSHTDVCIIGAGYAGTATAWHLARDRDSARPRQSITILEARGVCDGATGRNGGHLRPDLYGHIPKYIERNGLEAAVELAEFEIAHVPAIKEFVEEEGIDCDFVLARSVDVWSNQEAADAAQKVYEQMSSRSLPYMRDVFFKHGPEAETISGVKDCKAAASFTAGMLWPYKLITQVLKKLVQSGDLNLQTHAPVTEIKPAEQGGFTVKTARGTIHANKIVHANNAYVSKLLPEYTKNIIPCKGICCRIAVPEGKAAPHLPNSYIERSEDRTLSYLIPRPDGSIIVGGASSKFMPYREQWYDNVDDSVLIEAAKDYYTGYMQRTFRGWENSGAEVTDIWTGVMGYSYDSNAHIGEVPDRPGQYIVAGFNGHGMPVIWLGAKGLAKMINEDVPFEKSGVPRLFKTTRERIERAQQGREEYGDILGDGSLTGPADVIKQAQVDVQSVAAASTV
ncbi:Putative FAD dependent oxidoreductase, FAD/NAD(P)-binding domain superfamily [Septoria linicola]|uniref:FAD dependent oxidoreductase, FAD/NAD(P)-binding domain superfamily n=1 Tax=Septoria linicola TaxID=215465 RepID=A0A9Q9AZ31_9PEZI|nr:Putative FAD dependent oxidoreductase, FAD/NAD(P)-binding domain superfamily [Septoria linicola]